MSKRIDKKSIEPLEKEDVIQAVIIADNFKSSFKPIADNCPLALLPLVNIPLLDYALESLSRSGVQEVFLFCSMHMDQIKTYIKKSLENSSSWSLALTVQLVVSEGCRSFGDAMRDIDAKGLLRGHFILMDANSVTNINLSDVLDHHKRVCKKDKGSAMTAVFSKIGDRQTTTEDLVIAIDQSNNRILYHNRVQSQRNLELPLEVFLDRPELRIHHDLTDPGIAICSPSFLPLFSDNFDFQTRDDFIRGLLINEEILGSTLYCYPLIKENQRYAAKVANWQMYQIVSHDVINRWTYPLVPNMVISKHHPVYVMMRNNIYKNKNVTLAKRVYLKADVVIAENTSISENSTITTSVIGRGVKIGKNVQIYNTFIFDGAVIEDDCIISDSVLGNNVKIQNGSKITSLILGENVIIGPKNIYNDILVSATEADEDENYEKLGTAAFKLLDNDSDDSDSDCEMHVKRGPSLKPLAPGDVLSDYSSSSEEELFENQSPIPDDASVFLSEVIDSLARGYEEQLNCDYLILEINSSRYAYNMSLNEVNYFVVRALFSLKPLHDANDKLSVIKKLFQYFNPVVKNYIRGQAAINDCLRAVEDSCLSGTPLHNLFPKIVHFLYDSEIIEENAILNWHLELPEELKTSLNTFIIWLQDASEESSESD